MAKQTLSVSKILIVGAGLMGRGISNLFACAGLDVVVLDPHVESADHLPDGVLLTASPPEEPPDLIIETVFEILDVKIEVFRQMEAAYGDRPILASNTSGLPLEPMAAVLRKPQRFLGLHFFTPADVTPLVEVVRVPETDDAVVAAVVDVLARAGREAIVLAQPVVGNLWNRLQHAILHEAYYMVENGIARPEDIDKVMKRLLGPRFCVNGLLESKDLGGLEMHLQAQESIVPHLSASRTPSPILKRMVDRGHTGVRAGQGFFDWREHDPGAVIAWSAERLRRLNDFLDSEAEDVPVPLSSETP